MGSALEAPTVEPAAKEAGSVEAAGALPLTQATLDRLLAMAHAYRREGHDRQAMELYWELTEEHPGTPQCEAAQTVLLELAAAYERQGARHMARSIYERLL